MSLPWNDPAFKRALELHQKHGLIDLHVDSIIQQRLFRYDVRKPHKPGLQGQPLFWHADIPRMLEARYSGACMGIHYWPWESERGWREMNRQIDYLDAVAAADPRCIRVRTPDDWDRAHAEGKLAMAPGVEGAHMLNGKLDRVRTLQQRGVMYLTLTHFSRNTAITPAMGRGCNERDGLTPWGRDLVAELNRCKVVVDLAHANTPGVLDVCKVAQAPLLCTHTGVKTVHNHARNISDEEIDAIAELDGVIGVMYAPNFLAGKLRANTETILDHMQHIWERVGPQHVALGSDYDGWLPTIMSDHRDCRDTVRITQGLIQRGLSDDDIGLILRGNVMRVFRNVMTP